MSADLRAYLQPLAPLMEAARRALKETPFRLGDDPDDLLAAVVIAISTELSGPSLAVMDKLKRAEAERDQLRAAVERVKAAIRPLAEQKIPIVGISVILEALTQPIDLAALDQAPAAEQDGGGR